MTDREFSDEEMARDWTLTSEDKLIVSKYRRNSRLFFSIQLCAVRLYGRFLKEMNHVSPRILNYLNKQLDLPPSLAIEIPDREATLSNQRRDILNHLGFEKFGSQAEYMLITWIKEQAGKGRLPEELHAEAGRFLLNGKFILPGSSVLRRLVIRICNETHDAIFDSLSKRLPVELKNKLDNLLFVSKDGQKSLFYGLKEFPPSAWVQSIQHYLKQYWLLDELEINTIEGQLADPVFMDYLYRLTKRYNARDLKRFNDKKRYSLMLCFVVEARKILLDHLVKMQDQYIMDLLRKSKRIHEKNHRELRRRQKRAIDIILETTDILVSWPDDQPILKSQLWGNKVNESQVKSSLNDLKSFKYLEEHGLGNTLRNRYPTLRKYFSEFIHLPFKGKSGTEPLLKAISIGRELDQGTTFKLPKDAPLQFVPKELKLSLRDNTGKVQRSTWELSLALAIRDALRSGDLYLPKSKQHVSFWDLILDDHRWKEAKSNSYQDIKQEEQNLMKSALVLQFHQAIGEAEERFKTDDYATIVDGSLKLKRDERILAPDDVSILQKTIDVSMPTIRIEQLLTEVDRGTNFSRHFEPLQQHQSQPVNFYRTLIAALISQATNLGVVAMSSSVKGISVDMLRHVLQFYVNEETLKAASAEIINQHHRLPFSAIQGDGQLSSSDAQRFKIRANSLLASYYPRYFGYYEKAIGIYTHTSDQYAVYSTKVISCSPREALYVLDGLLENNTILKISVYIN